MGGGSSTQQHVNESPRKATFNGLIFPGDWWLLKEFQIKNKNSNQNTSTPCVVPKSAIGGRKWTLMNKYHCQGMRSFENQQGRVGALRLRTTIYAPMDHRCVCVESRLWEDDNNEINDNDDDRVTQPGRSVFTRPEPPKRDIHCIESWIRRFRNRRGRIRDCGLTQNVFMKKNFSLPSEDVKPNPREKCLSDWTWHHRIPCLVWKWDLSMVWQNASL